jgi:hypothetical protein
MLGRRPAPRLARPAPLPRAGLHGAALPAVDRAPSSTRIPSEAVRRAAWLATDSPAASVPSATRSRAACRKCPAGRGREGPASSEATRTCPQPGLAPRRNAPRRISPPAARGPPVAAARCGCACRRPIAAPSSREFGALGWEVAGERDLSQAPWGCPTGADVAKHAGLRLRPGRGAGHRLAAGPFVGAGVDPGGHWLDACAGAGGERRCSWPRSSATGGARHRAGHEAVGARRTLRAGRAGGPRGADPGRATAATRRTASTASSWTRRAPGSGTWRRAPHLKVGDDSPAGVRGAAALQRGLLLRERIRGSGLAVASSTPPAHSAGARTSRSRPAFLRGGDGFEPEIEGRPLLPQAHDGDGFFLASFRRAPARQLSRGSSTARAGA